MSTIPAPYNTHFYTSAAARCRRIGEVFGVELSVPSWERLQATRN